MKTLFLFIVLIQACIADMIDYYMMAVLPSLHKGTITSTYTGRTWMDRNLGASRVCRTFDDDACYGDYYQWGRLKDGHQKSASTTDTTQANSLVLISDRFIVSHNDWTAADSDGELRQISWESENPCPKGFYVPTYKELQDENLQNRDDAFSKLKLPASGYRGKDNGNLGLGGNYGYIWSSTPNATKSQAVNYYANGSGIANSERAFGYALRCIQKPKTIVSPVTGRVWMDRNLGAMQKCTQPPGQDAQLYLLQQGICFGDYYQWGRPLDGHQKDTSDTNATLANTIAPKHNQFITTPQAVYDWTTADSSGLDRNSSWNPCPKGFKIPTKEEWSAENIANASDAYNKLRLPLAGTRDRIDGQFIFLGVHGDYWTSTIGSAGSSAWYSGFSTDHNFSSATPRSFGSSVRCIQQQP